MQYIHRKKIPKNIHVPSAHYLIISRSYYLPQDPQSYLPNLEINIGVQYSHRKIQSKYFCAQYLIIWTRPHFEQDSPQSFYNQEIHILCQSFATKFTQNIVVPNGKVKVIWGRAQWTTIRVAWLSASSSLSPGPQALLLGAQEHISEIQNGGRKETKQYPFLLIATNIRVKAIILPLELTVNS